MNSRSRKQKGFTLIEVIVTIVIVALMGMMFFAYLGTTLTRSHEPLVGVRNLGGAVKDMEGFVAKYRQQYLAGAITWGDFITTLRDAGVVSPDLSGVPESSFHNSGFAVHEVTITRGNQTLSAIFTEYIFTE